MPMQHQPFLFLRSIPNLDDQITPDVLRDFVLLVINMTALGALKFLLSQNIADVISQLLQVSDILSKRLSFWSSSDIQESFQSYIQLSVNVGLAIVDDFLENQFPTLVGVGLLSGHQIRTPSHP